MTVILVTVFSYLLGAIPFAYIVTNLLTGKDIRNYGSGNVGATNASRLMGYKYGLLVGGFDILKGFIAVLLAQALISATMPEYLVLLAAIMAIIGHNWSIFLGFSGGKGVATTFGIILKLLPLIFIAYVLIWLSVVLLTRYVSLASIIGALALPVLVYYFKGDQNLVIFTLILAIFIIIRHSSNLKKLIRGEENRLTWPPTARKGDT
jgi:acyl phosphate:glycerol-3-phosphate acyltransferase